MKTLFLITNTFPFGLPESSFLREEVKYLREKFHLVIVSRNVSNELYVLQTEDTEIYRYDAQKGYNALWLIIRSLARKDFYSEIISCKKQGKLSINTLTRILRFMMRSIHFLKYLKKVASKYEKGSITYYTYWNDYATYTCTKIKRNDEKVVSRLHGGDLYKLSINGNYQPYKDITNELVDRLVFISEAGMKYYNSTYKEHNDKSTVCRLGVVPRIAQAQFQNKKSLKLVSFSYVRDIKRIDLIIDALALIDDVEVEWVHIGGGYIFDEILQYAHEKLDGCKNIKFDFKGNMKNEEALDFINVIDFDFLINVSSTEGLPMTMMEAMSMNIPVIGTNVGGISEIIVDQYNGFLLDADFQVSYLVKLLKSYSESSYEDKLALRRNAYNTWKDKFNESVNFKNFVNNVLVK